MKKALVFVLAMLFAISASAQSSSLTGTVADPSGKVIPAATVRLTFELNGEARSTTTDENGGFAFNALGAGEYTVRVEPPVSGRSSARANVLSAGRLAWQPSTGCRQPDRSVTVSAQGAGVATRRRPGSDHR